MEQNLSMSIVCMYCLHITDYTEGVYNPHVIVAVSINNCHIGVIITQLNNTISDIIMHNSIIFNLFT